VAEVVAAAAPRAQRPVGRIAGSFERGGRTDSAAGRLIADAHHRATAAPERGGAEFALTNPGGIRTDLPCRTPAPCTVTYGEVFAMQPFGNSLVVMTLSGQQLRRLLEDQQPRGRATPVFLAPSSTLRYRWDSRAPHGQRVQDIRIDGKPLDLARDVRLAVNSFLAEGGDLNSVLRQGRDRVGGGPDLEALVAHLAGTPAPDRVPRITWAD
jgi:5'-nucleotidase